MESRVHVPLVVDLDGTLINTDILYEQLIKLLKHQPYKLLGLCKTLLQGRAPFKAKLASLVEINPAPLPYNENFLNWLRSEHSNNRKIYLATASYKNVAEKICHHLGFFSGCFASTETINLNGHTKAQRLVDEFGDHNFDYAGNSPADLAVWRKAAVAIVVNANQRLIAQAQKVCSEVSSAFCLKDGAFFEMLRCFRPHQWAKNLLVFVPLILAHKITNISLLRDTLMAFLGTNLVASSSYIFNDLCDMEADRLHDGKKQRPFAAGTVSIKSGIILFIIMIGSGLSLSLRQSGWPLFFILLLYFASSLGYSLKFKKIVLLDIFVLAMLYVIRLFIGTVASHGTVPVSEWLLGFSLFFFASLAFLKRMSEMLDNPRSLSLARGYLITDLNFVFIAGLAMGCISIVILSLYINSPTVRELYNYPALLWIVCFLVLFWICRIWLLGQRKQLHYDPVVFSLTDRVSYLIFFTCLIVLLIAKKI